MPRVRGTSRVPLDGPDEAPGARFDGSVRLLVLTRAPVRGRMTPPEQRPASRSEPGSAAPLPGGAENAPVSLEGLHGSVAVPPPGAGFWAQWRAFVGPALLVGVGYMDPGNWGTDLAAGAQYRYGLLWVVGLASVMAIFMQVIAARLGVATGKDLAQACRDWYPAWTRWPSWLLCEAAVAACDLAEVLGSAVALNLLFHIPILWAVMLTAADVLLLLALQRLGMRTIEAVVLLLVATIATCYFLELFVLPPTAPHFGEIWPAPSCPRGSASRAWPSWPSASWVRRSCPTTSTCTPPWCRAGDSRRTTTPSAPPSASTPSTPPWRWWWRSS